MFQKFHSSSFPQVTAVGVRMISCVFSLKDISKTQSRTSAAPGGTTAAALIGDWQRDTDRGGSCRFTCPHLEQLERWINASTHNMAIDQYDRQHIRALRGDQRMNLPVVDKRLRLL
jgi:hypothetical protein